MSVKSNLLEYIRFKGIKKTEFYRVTGLSNGFLDKNQNISSNNLEIIISNYKDINLHWLLTGEPPMLKSDIKIVDQNADMALQIATEVNELENIPISIFGHSMGGIIAFELAKAIETHTNRKLNKIFVSGCRAPSTELKYKIGHLNKEDFLKEIIKFGGVDPTYQENPELLNFFLPILKEDIRLCESYQHQPPSPVNSPIIVLWGTEDNLLYEEQVRAWTQHSFEKVTFFPLKEVIIFI